MNLKVATGLGTLCSFYKSKQLLEHLFIDLGPKTVYMLREEHIGKFS